MVSVRAVSLALVTGSVSACGLVVGLGDDFTIAGDGGAIEPGGTGGVGGAMGAGDADSALGPDASPKGDAKVEADRDGDAVAIDTGLSDGGSCVPSPEICTDGVDNDCDGLVDCNDVADCVAPGAFACVNLPRSGGWTIVAAPTPLESPCPPGFQNPAPFLTSVSQAGSCKCACEPTGGCAYQEVVSAGKCVAGAMGATAVYPAGGKSCDPLTPPITGATGNRVQVEVTLDDQPLSCSPTGTLQANPPTLTGGETCAVEAVGACTGGACVPVAKGAPTCALHADDVACPNGLSKRLVYAGSTVSGALGCTTSCDCSAVIIPCSVTEVAGKSGAACGGTSSPFTVNQTVVSSYLACSGTAQRTYFAVSVSTAGSHCDVAATRAPTGNPSPGGAVQTLCCVP